MTQSGDSTADAAPSDRSGTGAGPVRTSRVSAPRTARPWLDRVGSLLAGGLLLFAAVRWWYLTLALTAPCSSRGLEQEVCDEAPAILQGLQFVIAVAGIVVAVLVAAVTLFQAVSGRRVPWLRTAVAVLAGLAVGWGLVYLIGLLFTPRL